MKEELADECDYSREASFLQKFGTPSFLGGDPRFKVPWVWQGSTNRVLVMQHVDGVSVGGKVIEKLSQADRNDVRVHVPLLLIVLLNVGLYRLPPESSSCA